MANAPAVPAILGSNGPRLITVGVIQFSSVDDLNANCHHAEERIREAAAKGANIILLPELFASIYFPMDQIDYFRLSVSLNEDKSYLTRFENLARELNVVLPISFYERAK